MTTTLTAPQLTDIQAALTQERDALLAQVSTLAESDQVLITARASQEERAKSAGDADLMGVERNVLARMTVAMTDGLSELDGALLRLAAGTYGSCSRCGEPIAQARLLARPRSTSCVPCASRR